MTRQAIRQTVDERRVCDDDGNGKLDDSVRSHRGPCIQNEYRVACAAPPRLGGRGPRRMSYP